MQFQKRTYLHGMYVNMFLLFGCHCYTHNWLITPVFINLNILGFRKWNYSWHINLECEGGSNVESEHHIKRTIFSSINGIATKSGLKRLYTGPNGWLVQLFLSSFSCNSNIPGIHQLILTRIICNLNPLEAKIWVLTLLFTMQFGPVERAEFTLGIINVAM